VSSKLMMVSYRFSRVAKIAGDRGSRFFKVLGGERLDEAEMALFVECTGLDELPKELAFRDGRLARIKQAMAELEAEAKGACGNEQAKDANSGDESKPDDAAKPAGAGRAGKRPADVPGDGFARG
jgi:hypothetical protein